MATRPTPITSFFINPISTQLEKILHLLTILPISPMLMGVI